MTDQRLPRILVVDDEEAILETMTFTFMDEYEVLTSTDARRALEILEEKAPVAVVISDQRMPGMTGSELLAEVYERFPETSRIILTGFANMDSTLEAINAGHVYAYVNKPWEPDELKQVVHRAYQHHALTTENHRLLDDLRRANRFLEAVIDRLSTGALAVDSDGVVQAANQIARAYLKLPDDPKGVALDEVMASEGLKEMAETVARLSQEGGGRFEDLELRVGSSASRVRISLDTLQAEGETIGSVIFFKEVSHEPLRRRFEEIVIDVGQHEGDLRERVGTALAEMRALADDVRASGITSPGMAELAELVSGSQTAMQNWLDVDDMLAREEYPDAQLLLDRMRIANRRWPAHEDPPARVKELAARVESYYESGENARQRVL